MLPQTFVRHEVVARSRRAGRRGSTRPGTARSSGTRSCGTGDAGRRSPVTAGHLGTSSGPRTSPVLLVGCCIALIAPGRQTDRGRAVDRHGAAALVLWSRSRRTDSTRTHRALSGPDQSAGGSLGCDERSERASTSGLDTVRLAARPRSTSTALGGVQADHACGRCRPGCGRGVSFETTIIGEERERHRPRRRLADQRPRPAAVRSRRPRSPAPPHSRRSRRPTSPAARAGRRHPPPPDPQHQQRAERRRGHGERESDRVGQAQRTGHRERQVRHGHRQQRRDPEAVHRHVVPAGPPLQPAPQQVLVDHPGDRDRQPGRRRQERRERPGRDQRPEQIPAVPGKTRPGSCSTTVSAPLLDQVGRERSGRGRRTCGGNR